MSWPHKTRLSISADNGALCILQSEYQDKQWTVVDTVASKQNIAQSEELATLGKVLDTHSNITGNFSLQLPSRLVQSQCHIFAHSNYKDAYEELKSSCNDPENYQYKISRLSSCDPEHQHFLVQQVHKKSIEEWTEPFSTRQLTLQRIFHRVDSIQSLVSAGHIEVAESPSLVIEILDATVYFYGFINKELFFYRDVPLSARIDSASSKATLEELSKEIKDTQGHVQSRIKSKTEIPVYLLNTSSISADSIPELKLQGLGIEIAERPKASPADALAYGVSLNTEKYGLISQGSLDGLRLRLWLGIYALAIILCISSISMMQTHYKDSIQSLRKAIQSESKSKPTKAMSQLEASAKFERQQIHRVLMLQAQVLDPIPASKLLKVLDQIDYDEMVLDTLTVQQGRLLLKGSVITQFATDTFTKYISELRSLPFLEGLQYKLQQKHRQEELSIFEITAAFKRESE